MKIQSNQQGQRGQQGSFIRLLAVFLLLGLSAALVASSFQAAPTTSPAASPLALGNYPNTSIALSANTAITPDAPPTNTTSINVSTPTSFRGALEGNPATGVVHVTDARPAGTYLITIRAFDGGSLTATKTFTLTVTTPATCNPVSFATPINFGIGNPPTSAAVGDFNGDGKQDLVVTNRHQPPPHEVPGRVSIFLGDGAGSLSAGASYAIGNYPGSVTVGDFNGDGNQDLALTAQGVKILLGDGTGNFSGPTSFASESFYYSVAVGDFNGDGKQDLAAVNGSNVTILLGDGAGDFSAPTHFVAGNFPLSVAVGDFNGDGKQDLAVANSNSTDISILLGNGTGSFSPATRYLVDNGPYSVVVGDFNNDGNQDLAVPNGINVSILLGDGGGFFGVARNFDAGDLPADVAVGDFNGDGHQDLAVLNLGSDDVSILLGDGTGRFSAPLNYDAGEAVSIAVGDFNSDGMQDLAVTNYFPNFILIFSRNCATPTPGPTVTPSPTPAITVSLPADTLDIQVPVSTVIIKPVVTTNLDVGLNLVGFQGDFTFDERICTFSSPFVEKAGLTSGNWNVSANILPNPPGPIRILRVSAISLDFMPLVGSGTLYNLRLLRVSSTPGAATPLTWRQAPDNFFFIDKNLDSHVPAQENGLITITGTPALIVTNTSDSGPGSLRQVIADAHDGDTIGFDPALNGQTISLTSGELVIDKNVSISGPGSDLLSVSLSPSAPPPRFRIIHIVPGHTVAIQGLTISGGSIDKFDPAFSGAGIFNEQGTLTIDSCAVSGNFSFYEGGGIANVGTLTVSRSTIIGNFGGFAGGGISNGGTLTMMNSTVRGNHSGLPPGVGGFTGYGAGIDNGGTATIVSSTIDSNTADGNQGSAGGGIYSLGSGSLTVSNSTISQNVAAITGGGICGNGSITNCTISGNTAPQGGGIVTSALEIGNTILNAGADGANIFSGGGTVTSHGYNVCSDNGGGFLTAPGDQINTDPVLGPLQDNGGPTFTHELLPGSPAINTGDPAFTPPPDFDQRGPGFPRVFNSRIDIGSFELQTITPTPTATATATATLTPTPSPTATATVTPTLIVTNTNDGGPGSLRQVIADGHDGDTIGFDAALNGQTIALVTGELTVDKNLTITGPGPDQLTISGSSASRIFHIMPSHTVAIQGLTISFGRVDKFNPSGPGSGIYNEQGTVTIDSCTISSNFNFYESGGIANAGTLTVSRSTISSNFGGFAGGGISNWGTLTIMNSTVRGNGSGLPQGVGETTGNGAGIYNAGMAAIISCTIDHNTAKGSGDAAGGGIYSAGSGPLTVSNSTISQNVAALTGGAIYGGGSITNCTISGNTAPQGGGIYVTSGLEIGNTILNAGANGANIVGVTVTSHGYNVSSDDGGGFLTGPGDQINTDPLLGPLQDNGGPTFTHELLPLSPAINAGDPAFTPPPDFDQRGPGYPRVFNSRIDIGSFELQVIAPTPTPSPTATATATPAHALNLSTRVLVQTGDNVGIGGFIITGSAPKQVVVRGIGPSLAQTGVPNALADPVLELHGPAGFVTIANDNWRTGPGACCLLDGPCVPTGLAPPNDLESMICATLNPGAYTAVVKGKNDSSGLALVEVYDLGPATSQLANISTRAFVGTGADVVIGGFILGSGDSSQIVVRGLGPSLAGSGLTGVLADPTLELHDGSGALLASNDNGGTCSLPPPDPLEACIEASLPPGLFTTILAGKDGGTGIGLLEIYNLQ